MTEPAIRRRPIGRLIRRKWFWAVTSFPLIVLAAANLLTAPLEPPSPTTLTSPRPLPAPAPSPAPAASWPETSLDGHPAKVLLLECLLQARARLDRSRGYTAVMRKVERLDGRLGDEQVMEMKCRGEPFAVYLKFVKPEAGKEVVFSTGHYDDCVVAHGVGLARRLVPRLKVPPTSALAMAGNRHPVTEAGLWNLTDRLIGYRRMDLKDPGAKTLLDRVRDDKGREWLRSDHTHVLAKADRPFRRVVVLYDPETRIPHQIHNYDWPQPGETGEPRLAETYHYEDVKLDIPLTDLDFDPANPAYAFTRF